MSRELQDFTPGQEALIEKIAWAVGKELLTQIKADRERDVHDHQETCPTKHRVDRFFWVTLGAAFGSACGGGGLVYIIMESLKGVSN